MSGSIVVRRYEERDRPALLELFAAVYGNVAGHRTSAWRYLEPAPYVSFNFVAVCDGQLVGAQPAHQIDLAVEGEKVPGLLLLDVMTHPGYRRRGVFSSLLETLREKARHAGYRLLLTTPNKDAARGFARLSGWRCLGELTPYVMPTDLGALLAPTPGLRRALAPISALRRRFSRPTPDDAGGVRVTSGWPDDAALSELGRRFAGATRCALARPAEFLRWRFSDRSGRDYRVLYASRDGEVLGAAFIASGILVNRPLLFLADLLLVPGASGAGSAILSAVRQIGLGEGHGAVVTWMAPQTPLDPLLRRTGFYLIPNRLRPRPYPIWGWAEPGDPRSDRMLDLASWHMTLTDSDLG